MKQWLLTATKEVEKNYGKNILTAISSAPFS
jgi:hypothetical protein